MQAADFQRVLIVDDEPANVALLEAIVRHEGNLSAASTTDSREALRLILEYSPDIILLDLMMPYLDGFRVIELVRAAMGPDEYLPVLVLTADSSAETMHRALSVGATDFITKPLDVSEVSLRMRNLLHTRRLYCRLQDYSVTLESRVLERTEDLDQARYELLERLARTTEYRDGTTGQHTQRVGVNAARVWSRLGLSEEGREIIKSAAPLHDIGKVGIPDSLLLRAGSLSPEEFEVVKKHTLIGADILSRSRFPVLQLGERIARWHHERWDGTGYPDGLVGTEAPAEARIVQVCDVFDALTQERPYKAAWSVARAIEEIAGMAGTQSDPDVVRVFCELAAEGMILVGD